LIVADTRDTAKFEEVLTTCRPHRVIHTAAFKAVGESMEKPDEYFEVNFHATSKMFELLKSIESKNLFFLLLQKYMDHLNIQTHVLRMI
jgi:UDP-glucose 4-epimerase